MERNQTPELLTPISSTERIHLIDIIRGFALLGILTVNMDFFNSPIYLELVGLSTSQHGLDEVIRLGIEFFAVGNFYTMFSFLFGFGFMIFMTRAEERGRNAASLYRRRLFFLFLFGLVHAFLFWAGDILIIYSFIGIFLFAFRKRSNKTILIWALLLVILTVALAYMLTTADQQAGTTEYDSGFGSPEFFEAQIKSSYEAFGEGSYGDIFRQRATDWLFVIISGIFGAPFILAMFLFGLYAAKRRIFHEVEKHITLIKRVWIGSLVIGVPMKGMYVYLSNKTSDLGGSLDSFYALTGNLIGGGALCFFYITSLILLCSNKRIYHYLSYLRNVGRMALTNYLMQTIICTTIFYSYGLGLYGQVGPALGYLLTLVIFAIQIVYSHYWFKRFSYGPAEWFWRKCTYGSLKK
ncbi:DUF418 domain-containing protein [Caldalkalibacillus mannanilyticus]|uniref:DUF418 domain-containing protein n=1 Tax=Caldalkalibacillus mannanilyticus TaxID=1418 RepID=UPI00046978CD|nr:DUF418 domain-containing protein [Caldalkalibacillus mannanilyticus]